MKDVIIIGAGGHGAEIDEYIKYSEKIKGFREFNVYGFIDDDPQNYFSYKFSAPLLGGIKDHRPIYGQSYIMGIANIKYRRHFIEKFKSLGAVFITFIHCTAYISESSEIGEGTLIGPYANIGPNVRVGKYNLINSRCSLGHDTMIGDYNFISPNVCFSGFTRIGDENLFGINSATIPRVSIGNRNKIAAGMILDQNVADETYVFHRFKEKVIAVPKNSSYD
jgi:sugar O-acyltransferase (sialic acid O-acetyltransferase NeuD family)